MPLIGPVCISDSAGLRSSRCSTIGPARIRIPNQHQSKRRYVLRLRSFLSLRDLHRYLLAFMQGLATAAIDSAMVNKNIFTAFTFNETESLFVIEPFNGAFYFV